MKKIAKIIVIVFLLSLVILAAGAKDFGQLFLPKVLTEPVLLRRPVYSSFPVEGVIQAKKTTDVSIFDSIVVDEVYYKAGEVIAPGDVLFKGRIVIPGQDPVRLLEEELARLTNDLAFAKTLQYEMEEEGLTEESRKQLEKDLKDLNQAISDVTAQLSFLEQGGIKKTMLNEAGEFIAKEPGVLKTMPSIGQVIPAGEQVLSYDNVADLHDVFLKITVDKKTLEKLRMLRPFTLRTDDDQFFDVQIVTMDFTGEDGQYEVSAQLLQGTTMAKVGQRLTGDFTVRTQDYYFVVPRAAVKVASGNLARGELGSVYVVTTLEGVLGKETIAKEVSVYINEVGEDYIAVSPSKNLTRDQVITNLSDAITDGQPIIVIEEVSP